MAKRAFDILVSSLALLLLAPLMLLIALRIRLESGGPVLFRQERIGRHGVPFRIRKFRTMVVDAPDLGLPLTIGDDPRITATGRWLREHRLDELPQLLDVLQGHMSLVGPRPEVPRYLPHYPPDLRARILSVRPGITDPASIENLDESQRLAHAADPEHTYIHEILPRKLRRQADYAATAGLGSDLGVLLRTVAVLLGPQIRPYREPLSLLIDGTVVALAWQVTYLFRLGFERWISARPSYDGLVLAGIVLAYIAVFAALRVPRGMWRFTGFGDIQRLAAACGLAGVGSAVVVSGMLELQKVPRAVLALHPFVVLMGLCAVRLLYRMSYEHLRSQLHPRDEPPRRALILGAGEAARRLIAGIDGQGWQILGLLDDDPNRHGRSLGRTPVLGPIESVQAEARRLGATHLVLAMPSVQGRARRRIIECATASGLPLLTVPSADELMQGAQAARVRDIEPDDLLGREPVELDEPGIAQLLRDRVVAVTGAGGSIGSQLCEQVARYRPSALLLIESSEYALYRLEQTLRERHPDLQLQALIADVRDEARLRDLFARLRPAIVFHAAAYKHVPLMEVGNARAALHNNALGTWSAARAAQACGAERFVLISTDKAVNPTNVMGATKRLAELLILHLAQQGIAAPTEPVAPTAPTETQARPSTRFIAVRFGNVLGSSGSVIPRFKAQIAKGGPVTVTHPEIIRYFMTIAEASRLVLQAAALGEGGQVLVLDMGEPVKIADLARTMIRLSGHAPQDIPIVYTGLRPGEKLYEELLADTERTVPTTCASLRVAHLASHTEGFSVQQWLAEARTLPADDDAAVRAHLARWVPEYRPAS